MAPRPLHHLLALLLLVAFASSCKPAVPGRAPLVSALARATKDIKHRFFFPGHNGGQGAPELLKRLVDGGGLLHYDLPELDGLDNIHSPEGPLMDSLAAAAQLYGAKRTWYLLNGSTGGILCAVLAVVRLHEARARLGSGSPAAKSPVMLIGRDSHKAVYDALSLANCDAALLPCNVDSEFGIPLGVQLQSIRQAAERFGDRVCGLLLTRPTYQGVAYSSNALSEVAALCRSRGFALLIDEAHGSHLRFLHEVKYAGLRDGLSSGADIVVQSSHKTLSSLSQTGMMHISPGSFAYLGASAAHLHPEQVLHDAYSMLTTTSPNSILLASLDATVAQMGEEGRELVGSAAAKADALRRAVRDAPSTMFTPASLDSSSSGGGSGVYKDLELLDDSASVAALGGLLVDPLRLSVRFSSRDSTAVDDKMCDEKGIFCELNLPNCITYGVPLGVPEAQMQLLCGALLDEAYTSSPPPSLPRHQPPSQAAVEAPATTFLSIRSGASSGEPEVVEALSIAEDSSSRPGGAQWVSADSVYLYPPGVPLLLRGEVITPAQVRALLAAKGGLQSGCQIFGAADASLRTLRVRRLHT